MKSLPLLSAVLALACAAGCNYAKQVVTIDLANRSGETIRNIEVTHPTGGYGLAELKDGQMNQYKAPAGSPCKFELDFQDAAAKKYTGNYDFGTKCPAEIALEVGAQLRVTSRAVRP